jgi:ankyrin repeat protein
MSILHMAIAKERLDLLDLILVHANGIDINVMSPTHGTPLHVASRTGNIKIVQRLVVSGANIYIAEAKNG